MRLRRHPEVAWVASEGRVASVRLDRLADTPLVLTGGAAVIWEVLDVPLATDDIVEAVAAEVGVTADVVAADVAAFVDQALTTGLLTEFGAELDDELSPPPATGS